MTKLQYHLIEALPLKVTEMIVGFQVRWLFFLVFSAHHKITKQTFILNFGL